MKKIALLFILFLGFISCSKISPKGEIEVKDVTVENFTKLNLKGDFKVFFAKAEQNLVSVETYPNIYKNLDIEVKNGILTIEENRKPENVDFYSINIFGKNDLNEISLSDHVEMNVSGQVKSSEFLLNLKDNSKFMGAVISDKSKVDMAQKSNANILGETKILNLKLADSASIMAPYFYVENLEMNAKNGTSAGLNIDNEMKGTLENTSKLIFYGEPLNKLTKKDQSSVENRKLR
ncbi:hypothetical protein GCM10010992_02350 [Cloacibacterium rupense]|uniref:Putative auto-transporter adhesin head GIN domain-containing protein n=1 Tax=Cloacibacterium rupense TaxID=517423 RepID=A0ABQ2NHQ0_9FLAO|nr:DUF2807 domain-containing protein [Cloacibacterium rupense]GGP01544.1 hypothetical protein GCM10010992_02350 [Cloacibacterium rupense]